MPSAIQFPLSASNQCYQKCCQFGSQLFQKSTVEDCFSVLSLRLSRTERRGADTVLQPDLYSGQDVYYIKKVMGLCKSTCPTFLQNFLKPSTTSKRQIRLAVGRGEEVCAQTLSSPPNASLIIQRLFPLLLSLYSSIYSIDIAVHFLVPHLFDIITCNTRWNIFKIQHALQF